MLPVQQISAVPQRHQAASSLHCRKAGDGQNEICDFKLTPGLTLPWEEVLDNFKVLAVGGKGTDFRSRIKTATGAPSQRGASILAV